MEGQAAATARLLLAVLRGTLRTQLGPPHARARPPPGYFRAFSSAAEAEAAVAVEEGAAAAACDAAAAAGSAAASSAPASAGTRGEALGALAAAANAAVQDGKRSVAAGAAGSPAGHRLGAFLGLTEVLEQQAALVRGGGPGPGSPALQAMTWHRQQMDDTPQVRPAPCAHACAIRVACPGRSLLRSSPRRLRHAKCRRAPRAAGPRAAAQLAAPNHSRDKGAGCHAGAVRGRAWSAQAAAAAMAASRTRPPGAW